MQHSYMSKFVGTVGQPGGDLAGAALLYLTVCRDSWPAWWGSERCSTHISNCLSGQLASLVGIWLVQHSVLLLDESRPVQEKNNALATFPNEVFGKYNNILKVI